MVQSGRARERVISEREVLCSMLTLMKGSNKIIKEPKAITSILRVGQSLHDELSRPSALTHRLRQSLGYTLRPCARYLNLWEGLPAAKSSSHISCKLQ